MNNALQTIRWIARLTSLATIAVISMMAMPEQGGERVLPTATEWTGLAMFPVGVCAGLIIAFFRPRLGGWVSIGSLIGFYVWHVAVAGGLPGGPYFAILTSPAIFWLWSDRLRQPIQLSEPPDSSSDNSAALLAPKPQARDSVTPPDNHTAIVVTSLHHENTQRIARAMAETGGATLLTPEQAFATNLANFDLVGFGSGIYFGQHHAALRKLVHALPRLPQNVFIFSTAGLPLFSRLFHWRLRHALKSRGCRVVDEFSCRGWDTVGPLLLMGGLNRHHPDANDFSRARKFANRLNEDVARNAVFGG